MKIRDLAEDQECMCTTGRHPKPLVGFGGKHVAVPFTEGRGACAQIHKHIEHCAGGDPNEFALGRGATLVVETAEDILGGPTVVILHELGKDSELGEGFLVPRFEEKTARIPKHAGSEQECPIDFCGIASHAEIRNVESVIGI